MANEIEWLLRAILNDETIKNFTPRSRMEEYLHAALSNAGTEGLSIPRSRIDALLYEFAQDGVGDANLPAQEKTVTPTLEAQSVTADSGYRLTKVNVEPAEEVYDEGYSSASTRFLMNGRSRWSPIKMEHIPKNITELRRFCFAFAYLEENVVLPEHITSFEGNGLFYSVMNTKKITIHNGITTSQINCFSLSADLEEVIYSNSVAGLASGMFNGCAKLKRVTNLGNITSINSNCFQGSTALEYIEFESLKVGTSGVKLNYSNNLTVECLVGILNSLVDMTGVEGTHTLYLGSTNLAKLTEEQQQIAYDKNIELA